MQGAATFSPGDKCPGDRYLNKCQVPAYLGPNSCQVPGCCPGGWALLDLIHTLSFEKLIQFCARVAI